MPCPRLVDVCLAIHVTVIVPGVGKTSIMHRYADQKFSPSLLSTAGYVACSILLPKHLCDEVRSCWLEPLSVAACVCDHGADWFEEHGEGGGGRIVLGGVPVCGAVFAMGVVVVVVVVDLHAPPGWTTRQST